MEPIIDNNAALNMIRIFQHLVSCMSQLANAQDDTRAINRMLTTGHLLAKHAVINKNYLNNRKEALTVTILTDWTEGVSFVCIVPVACTYCNPLQSRLVVKPELPWRCTCLKVSH